MAKDFRNYALFEKEELVFNTIKKYPKGVPLVQIAKDLNVAGKEYVKKIAKILYKKRKIRIIRIGWTDIYCVREDKNCKQN